MPLSPLAVWVSASNGRTMATSLLHLIDSLIPQRREVFLQVGIVCKHAFISSKSLNRRRQSAEPNTPRDDVLEL